MSAEARCNLCHIGQVHLVSAPYVTQLGQQVLVMSKAPAYSCDVCGHLTYDAVFLENLYYLIGARADSHSYGVSSPPAS